MKLFLKSPIDGSPTGTVSARISDYLRHKLYFSERFDEDDPESRLEFYAREAMTSLAIVQCLLAKHPSLHDDVFFAEGEMRGDIEHSEAEAVRALVEAAPKRKKAARAKHPKAATRSRNARSSRASKRARRTELSPAGREAITRAARQRWKRWQAEKVKGGKVSGS